jgi:hypothetical protein
MRNKWLFENNQNVPTKKDLVKWVSKTLKITLSKANIKSDFATTSIYLYNPHVFEKKYGLLHLYRKTFTI